MRHGRPRATLLSQIAIDGAKDWNAKTISNPGTITKELFLPAYGYTDAALNAQQGHNIAQLADAAIDAIYFEFKVPEDFVALLSIKGVWFASPASGNLRWKLSAKHGASGEAAATHQRDSGYGDTATGGAYVINVQTPATSLTLPDIALGDYIGIYFGREGNHANDTINAAAYIAGLLFTYTAKQINQGV